MFEKDKVVETVKRCGASQPVKHEKYPLAVSVELSGMTMMQAVAGDGWWSEPLAVGCLQIEEGGNRKNDFG